MDLRRGSQLVQFQPIALTFAPLRSFEMQRKWVAVEVECSRTGIKGIHYVEVSPSLTHPVEWAKRQERELGYLVLSAWVW